MGNRRENGAHRLSDYQHEAEGENGRQKALQHTTGGEFVACLLDIHDFFA